MKKLLMIMAMVGVIAMAGVAEAVVYNFNGTGGTTWDLGTNWTPNNPAGLPHINGGDTYTVGGAFSTAHNTGSHFAIGSSAGTATLNINTTGTVQWWSLFAGGGAGASAQVTQTDGTANVTGTAAWGMALNAAAGQTARYDMDGGSLTVDNWVFMDDTGGGSAYFDQTAGTVTHGNHVGNDYFVLAPSNDTTVATWQISGGSLTVNTGTERIGIGIESRGGGAGDGGAGTFWVDGTGPSAITWNGNTIVKGTGTNKGALKYTMAAAGVTPIDINGILTLNDSPDLVLDMSGLGAGVGDILLVDNDGGDAIVGTFNVTGLGLGYTLTYLGGDGNDLVLVAPPIPEPGSFALLALGLGGMLGLKRRK